MRELKIYCDAACDNKLAKPIMGIGIHANCNGREVFSKTLNAGQGTSNIGEWIGCIEAIMYGLEVCKNYDKITIYSDSQLITYQLLGIYEVKEEHLKPFRAKALEVLNKYPLGKYNTISWIKRDLNQRADDLSKEGLQRPLDDIQWLKEVYKH